METRTNPGQDLLEQITNITKAHAYDTVTPLLRAEIEALKKDVEVWKTLALKYRELIKEHENSIQEFLKH